MHFPVVPCALLGQSGSLQRTPPPWALQCADADTAGLPHGLPHAASKHRRPPPFFQQYLRIHASS
jgi:hypothetical protein